MKGESLTTNTNWSWQAVTSINVSQQAVGVPILATKSIQPGPLSVLRIGPMEQKVDQVHFWSAKAGLGPLLVSHNWTRSTLDPPKLDQVGSTFFYKKWTRSTFCPPKLDQVHFLSTKTGPGPLLVHQNRTCPLLIRQNWIASTFYPPRLDREVNCPV